MNKIFIISSCVLSIIISGCGLFVSKPIVNIPDDKEIEKMKEDIKKDAYQTAGIDNEKRERLKKSGKEAPATIEKVEDTNVTVNKNPKVRMYLKVKPKGEDPFDAVVEMVVSRVNIPRSGDDATVIYDPSNKNDIIVK